MTVAPGLIEPHSAHLMKAALFFVLIAVARLAEASPEKEAAEQQRGVDLLTADHCHDAKGNLMVLLPDKTPFDADAGARKRYQNAFAAGFVSGFTGILSAHDSMAKPCPTGELEGWSAGQWAGYRAHQKEGYAKPHQ